jgi:hypothetical protein
MYMPSPERYWLVVGRISGDWEDTAGVHHCRTELQATRAFKKEMMEGTDKYQGVPKADLPTVYINTVAVSDTPIEITTYQ